MWQYNDHPGSWSVFDRCVVLFLRLRILNNQRFATRLAGEVEQMTYTVRGDSYEVRDLPRQFSPP